MRLEDIQSEWEVDCNINQNDLSTEVLKIPKLHSKYYRYYIHEVMVFKKKEAALKDLRLRKYEFYTMGRTVESERLGWELPARGKVLKSEVQPYIDADKDIISETLSLSLQKEKVDFLEEITKSFVGRGFNIKSAIEFLKFKNGG